MTDEPSNLLRFGVLGVGKIACTRFFPSVASLPHLKVTGIGTRQPGRLDSASLPLPARPEVLGYHEFVERGRGLMDAVYIALPNDLHVPWILRCAASGVHVLCEKPLAVSRADALRCRQHCEEQGVLLGEACKARHDVRHGRVRELIASGRLGEVHLLEASFSYFLEDLSNIRLQPERLGGALLDVGCYGIDIARFVFAAEPVEVTARCLRGGSSGVDEVVAVSLLFAGGRMAVVTASTHLSRYNAYRIRGTHGTVIVPKAFIPDEREATEIIVEFSNGEREVEEFPPCSPYREQIAHFCRAIRAGDREQLIPTEDGVANAGILEAAVRSMGEQGRVSLDWRTS